MQQGFRAEGGTRGTKSSSATTLPGPSVVASAWNTDESSGQAAGICQLWQPIFKNGPTIREGDVAELATPSGL
jgi:hypothetical protein